MERSSLSDGASPNSWQQFWARGGWWKAAALSAAYLALYVGTGWTIGQLWGGSVNVDVVFGDALSVFLALALPVLVGSVLLIGFALTLGWWTRPLFSAQPVRGKLWMWLAPVLILGTITMRVLGIDWGSYTFGVVAVAFLAGTLRVRVS